MFNGVSEFYNGVATQSLRFDDGSSHKLTRTFSGAVDNDKKMTISVWAKRGNLSGSNQVILANYNDVRFLGELRWSSDNKIGFDPGGDGNGASNSYFLETSALFRDVSAWYHIVLAYDSTQSTDTNRVKLYVNGTQQTLTAKSGHTFPPLNYAHLYSYAGANNTIGEFGAGFNSGYLDGYLSEFNFIDGLTLDPTYFGEAKNGIWIAKKYTGSYGTNGYRLQFNQTGVGTASSSTIGADTSGNTNHWTSSGIVASDCAMPDSPENNFSTMNPLQPSANTRTFSEGNLRNTHSGNQYSFFSSTHSMKTGKWYAEMRFDSNTTGEVMMVGIAEHDIPTYQGGENNDPHTTAGTIFYISDGAGYYDGSSVAHGAFSGSVAWGDHTNTSPGFVIGLALDLDSGTRTITFTKDGGNSFSKNLTSNFTSDIVFAVNKYSGSSGTAQWTWNFGQDSTFGGQESAGGNTDGNGNGDFHSAVPSGYLALCTANFPEPTIGPNSASQSDDYFNTVLYDGTGSSNSVTGVGFQPDWVWIKKRSGGSQRNHILTDSMRGVTKHISTALEDGQFTNTNGLTAFGADGFTVGSYDSVNESGSSDKYVSWNWICNGGTTTSVDAGSGSNISNGTSNHATVQVNQTAGFSMVTTTLTVRSTAVATIPHGLGDTPHWIIAKQFDTSNIFSIYHQNIPSNSIMLGGQYGDDDKNSGSNFSSVGSTTFGHQTNSISNNANENHIFYCFREIAGYSKFGAYEGNGSADGAFVYTGFRPAWLMIKNVDTDGENWHMFDNKRATSNVVKARLIADASTHENTNDSIIDFTSNGFKLRDTNAGYNSAVTFVYFAFAETPFKYANAR